MSEHDPEGYHGEERRKIIQLTEEQLDAIAERASKKVLEHFHIELGKVTIRGFMYLCGAVGVALLAYLGISKEILK